MLFDNSQPPSIKSDFQSFGRSRMDLCLWMDHSLWKDHDHAATNSPPNVPLGRVDKSRRVSFNSIYPYLEWTSVSGWTILSERTTITLQQIHLLSNRKTIEILQRSLMRCLEGSSYEKSKKGVKFCPQTNEIAFLTSRLLNLDQNVAIIW